MKALKKGLALGLALLFTLMSAVSASATAKKMTFVWEEPSMADSVNTLNWKVWDQTAGSGNIVYSPYSLESALAMALAGAEGNTKTQLETAMGISDLNSFLKDYKSYTGKKNQGATLTTANSVWINLNELGKNEVKSSYEKTVKNYLGADVKKSYFGKNTSKEMSAWVKQKTNGLIADYSPVVQSNTAVDLLNAVYFKGDWETPFSEYGTYDDTFTSLDGSKATVPLMHMGEKKFRYYSDGKVKGLELPYKDSTLVMDLVLPVDTSDRDVVKLWNQYNASEKNRFFGKVDKAEKTTVGNLILPKFTVDASMENVSGVLKAIGITDAFDSNKANFDGMAHGLYISDVAHRAKIEVDEVGTKAAAVTEIAMNKMALLPPEDYVDFLCNVPFLYVIRDTSNGMILFTGVMNTMNA